MGKRICGPRAIDVVEDYVCKLPKPSLVTPYRIEKDTGLDHSQADACLESLAPHPGEASLYELCEETGQGRWLIKSASNQNEYWIDEQHQCMIEAIRTSDNSGLSSDEKERLAIALVKRCEKSSDLARLLGLAAGASLALDGLRRMSEGDGRGRSEFVLGAGTFLLSIIA